jgi:Cu+-exporting ATPase
VFDKTGTLTDTSQAEVEYHGRPLTAPEKALLATVAAQSTHPLSQRLAREFAGEAVELASCQEIAGQGISGVTADSRPVRLGAASFAGSSADSVGRESERTDDIQNPHYHTPETRVHLALDGEPAGYFTFRNVYRPALASVLGPLGRRYRLAVLSGDTDAERLRLQALFGEDAELRFRQSPGDKLAYIAAERARGRTVVMVGDGLNDAGALRAADAGIALTDRLTNFSPACDAILDAGEFGRLATFLSFSRACLRVVLVTFGLSFCYNGFGLALAVQGRFTPIVSAFLMPISSLSVMVVATLLVRWAAKRHQL